MPLPACANQPVPLPHPDLWRASQISHENRACLATGHAALSAELPGQGWPCGALIELLAPRPGIGEMHLLQPALARLSGQRSVVLLQPPHMPNIASWKAWGLNPRQLLWLRPKTAIDAMWAADQVLKAGSCAALLCWFPQIHADALRRLHGAAQSGDTLFVAMRPAEAARQSSPATLRLALQPAPGRMLLRFIKRRGPPRDAPLYVRLHDSSQPAFAPVPHAPVDRPTPTPAEPERFAPALVG